MELWVFQIPILQYSNTPALFMGGDRELSIHRPARSQDR
jgi:type IV secretory pathway TrbD component